MNFSLARKLEEMKRYGAQGNNVRMADQVLYELSELLPVAEYGPIQTALAKYRNGGGREDLDKVCNDLIKKYRGLPPPRTSMVCT